MTNIQIFTKYEKARILGARALQLAMNAPLLLKISDEDLLKINYDALKIAEIELDSGVLPISIKKPFPEKKEGKLRRENVPKISDKKVEAGEEHEEEKIGEENSEIMELANPDDEESTADGDDDGGEAGD